MSVSVTHFDADTGRSSSGNATQACFTSEGRHEGRITHKSRSGVSDVEPTEVGLSHKIAHGKTNDRTQLKLSKVRSHVASARNDGSPQTLEYVSSHSHTQDVAGSRKMRPETDYSVKPTSDLCASKADSRRSKFMANIPGIPVLAANEQLLAQRGDRAGHTTFPPTSVTNCGQHFPYSLSSSSDVKASSRNSNKTGDSVAYKQSANRFPKASRVKGQTEVEMQWNATTESHCRPRDDLTDSRVNQRNWEMSEHHYSRTRARRNKDGGTPVFNDVRHSGATNRQHLPRRASGGFKSASLSESPTDSQPGSSSEAESDISSSPDTSFKRRRRTKRKSSSKSIGSSMYGEDNTSDDSENHSISEISDASLSANAQRWLAKPESDGPNEVVLVSNKERQSVAGVQQLGNKKLRSSSLTSVSSLEGGNSCSNRIQSPLTSPSATGISRVKKVQIQSFSSLAEKNQSNKENRPERRISIGEGEQGRVRGRAQSEPASQDFTRSHLPKDGSASPSLSRNPFGLKSKTLSRKSSKESLVSDSEYSTFTENVSCWLSASEETAGRCSSAPPPRHVLCSTTDSQDTRLALCDRSFGSQTSAFFPVVPTKIVHTPHAPSLPVVSPESRTTDSQPQRSTSPPTDVLQENVSRSGSRPLSIVQEEAESLDITEDENYTLKHVVQKLCVPNRSSPPIADVGSTLRRLSYVKAQNNAADIPLPSQNLSVNQEWDSDSPTYSLAFGKTNRTVNSQRYTSQVASNTQTVLDEFDSHNPNGILSTFGNSEAKSTGVAAPVLAEDNFIPFDDENGEVKKPVKRRKKKISRPKIPAILDLQMLEEEITVEDPGPFEDSVDIHQKAVSLDIGKQQFIFSFLWWVCLLIHNHNPSHVAIQKAGSMRQYTAVCSVTVCAKNDTAMPNQNSIKYPYL